MNGSQRPLWLSDELYPFESRFFEAPGGHRIHYVDEGSGSPIVFVHGNPSWSLEFRHLIKGLRADFRCIAPDHAGFGLSSRSNSRADWHPQAHAQRFASLLEHLELKDMTLFMTDWGGPIGLDFARKHPDRVKGLVIANTWCWPVSADRHFKMFSFMMRSWVGQLLIKRFNFFVTQVMPRAMGNKAAATREVMAHYRNALPTPESRAACAALPGYIIGATDWIRSIWDDRSTFIDKPALLLWGAKDIAFREKELERWESELTNCSVRRFADCGHFLAEEAPERILPVLQEFMAKQ